ncbi:MAG: sulfatase-like hydrolase/transferase [Promethearchaeota archaeon]
MTKRVILITIDCLRNDRLEACGYPKNIMPHINKFSKEAYIFENAIANGSYTASSFYAMFTSEIPGAYEPYAPLPIQRKKIAEILQKNKIFTCAIHSNPHLDKFANYHLGFDDFFHMKFTEPEFFTIKKKIINHFYDFLNYFKLDLNKIRTKVFGTIKQFDKKTPSSTTSKANAPYIDAKNITVKAIKWLKKHHKSNFFLWIHYMDPHGPYYPPSEYIAKISEEIILDSTKILINEIRKSTKHDPSIIKKIDKKYISFTNILYDAEINYTDHYIGVLFHYLKKLDLFNETNIIITADHGDAIFEHNTTGHQATLYDELLRIPLIIKLNNGTSHNNKIISAQVELLDIAPTILDLYNLPRENEFKGISLLPLLRGESNYKHSKYVLSSILHDNNDRLTFTNLTDFDFKFLISCRTLEWKLIYDDQIKKTELYNLKEDPKELNDLSNIKDNKILEIKNKFMEKIKPIIREYNSEEQIIRKAVKRLIVSKKFSNLK